MHPQIRKNPRRMLFLTLLGMIALLAVACGGTATTTTQGVTKAPDSDQILVYPINGRSDIQSFDPALVSDMPSIMSVDLVFTGLVELDKNLQVRDQLAQSHSVAADGITWTFKLKPNLKFSDGKQLTSADVAYSIDRALKPELKSSVSPLYLGLLKDSDKRNAGQIKTLIGDSVLTPDPQTVVLIANKKAAYFLQTLTYQTSYVVEKSMIDKYGDNFADYLSEGIGGDGPFKVSKYIRGKQIEFVPNENYEGAKPQLKKIVMPFYQNINTTWRAYQASQLDQANVDAAQLPEAKALPGGQFHQIPYLDIYYFGMNYLAKPFDNLKIRQAFALALNKDAITRNVYRDKEIASNHIIPKGMPGYNENLTGPQGEKGTSGNPELAKKLLADGMKEAGYTPTTFPQITLEFASLGGADRRNELAAEQQMWKSVLGITVKLDDIDYNKLLDLRNSTVNNPNGMQMWGLDWSSDYPDPQDWLTLIFNRNSSKNAMNYGQNRSAMNAQQQAIQKLMQEADVTVDQNKRLEMYNQAEQALVNDVAWIPRFQDTTSIVRKPCLVGMADNAQGLYAPDSWADVYITTAQPCANTKQYT